MDAVTSFRDKKEAQSVAAMRKRLDHAEKLVSALVTDMEFIKQRLAKVEVVKAGPQTHDVAGTTFEAQQDHSRDVTLSDLDEPQRPETE